MCLPPPLSPAVTANCVPITHPRSSSSQAPPSIPTRPVQRRPRRAPENAPRCTAVGCHQRGPAPVAGRRWDRAGLEWAVRGDSLGEQHSPGGGVPDGGGAEGSWGGWADASAWVPGASYPASGRRGVALVGAGWPPERGSRLVASRDSCRESPACGGQAGCLGGPASWVVKEVPCVGLESRFPALRL